MATIHIARAGTSLGSFSGEEVREGLRTGQFYPTDLAWQEGMPDWRPLGQLMAEKPAPAAPPPGVVGTGQPQVSPTALSFDGNAAENGLPWEHRQQLGIAKAFFET